MMALRMAYLAIVGLLLVTLLACMAVPVQAAQYGADEVRAAVETWVRYVTADARPDAVVERMEPYPPEGQTMAYIAHLSGGGFCLAGASVLVLPVYLYSPTGVYDPLNPDCRYILEDIANRQRVLERSLAEGDTRIEKYQDDLKARAALWQQLIAGQAPSISASAGEALADPVRMELPLTSRWHQGSPYNDQCPNLTPGVDERTAVGCVATAMAQLMRYWQWPPSGTGTGDLNYDWRWTTTWLETPLTDPHIPSSWSSRLRWTPAGGGKLQMYGYWDESLYRAARCIPDPANCHSPQDYLGALQTLWNGLSKSHTPVHADFAATLYDWNAMKDSHSDPSDDGDMAAATVNNHAGVAVGMKYGLVGSSAFLDDIDNALADHFRYDPVATVQGINVQAIVEEIQWLRPAILAGRNQNDEGHAWVLCGYNTETVPEQFLMNMGWGRGCTDWYSLDNVPFPNEQKQVIFITPRDIVKFIGQYDWGPGIPGDPYHDIEAALRATPGPPDGATLIFKADSVNTFSAPTLVISRPFTLKGKNVTIRRQP